MKASKQALPKKCNPHAPLRNISASLSGGKDRPARAPQSSRALV